jgi:hypothetical protein
MIEDNITRLHDKDQLVRDIIAVYSENHTKLINTLCGQTAKIINVKIGGGLKC